jgi:cell division protein FtsB
MRRSSNLHSTWLMIGRRFSGHLQEAISKRRWRWLVGAVMFYLLFGGDMGLVRLIGLRHERAELARATRALEVRHAQLQADLRRYTSDPFSIEVFAREQLDWGRRGEKVYKFPDK